MPGLPKRQNWRWWSREGWNRALCKKLSQNSRVSRLQWVNCKKVRTGLSCFVMKFPGISAPFALERRRGHSQENWIDHAASTAALKRGFLSGLLKCKICAGYWQVWKAFDFQRPGEMVSVERIRLHDSSCNWQAAPSTESSPGLCAREGCWPWHRYYIANAEPGLK